MEIVPDRWGAGSTYESFMGRWSRRLAALYVDWLEQPGGQHWLDVGCGTSALTGAICERAAPASVTGCDPNELFIAHARSALPDERAAFVRAGVGSLPPREGGYGGIASLLALNFFPDARAAIGEMRALAATGGVISACVWDYAEGMQFLRIFWDAAIRVDPTASKYDEGSRFAVCTRDGLAGLFREAGLAEVRCEGLEIPTVFAGFEDYWRPFLGGTGSGPSYVATLDEKHRGRLAQSLEQALPREADGSIALTARAWAARGTVG